MFDYKKHYVFSVDKYIIDMIKIGVFVEDVKESYILWAKDIDGKPVIYVSDNIGVCDVYVVDPDWCIEADPYTIK